MKLDDVRPQRWLGPELETGDQVLRGAVGFVKLEEGLFIHFSNAEDLHDLRLESECGPRICVSLFLEGAVHASVGDFKVPMPVYDAEARKWTPAATVYSQLRKEKFVRIARRGARLKKIVLSMSHDWLATRLDPRDPDCGAVLAFARTNFSKVSWEPSAHAVSLAEQIIAAPNRPAFQSRLYIASRAYGLLEEAFQQFSKQGTALAANNGDSQDRQKLMAVEAYLGAQQGHWVSAEELASSTAMSVNSLQRLLTRTHGLSTSRFIRRFMLERAREALGRDAATIAEAAHLAGYSSPANFSTAFKREFGLSPKQVI